MKQKKEVKVVVLISANIEWRVISELFPGVAMYRSPFGEWFISSIDVFVNAGELKTMEVVYFHGGWGKISAGASTQYVIDHWHPELLINFGTCGGLEGRIDRGTIILVEKTIVYDIIEQMYISDDHIHHYTTQIDLSWLGTNYPLDVKKSLLISADRDLLVEEIPELVSKYNAVAGDWESGAIAYVASKNQVKTLILRGVTDLVGKLGGEAYQDSNIFEENTKYVIRKLIKSLPEWIKISNIP